MIRALDTLAGSNAAGRSNRAVHIRRVVVGAVLVIPWWLGLLSIITWSAATIAGWIA